MDSIKKQVVLASKSPRRKELLEKFNIDFIVDPSNSDEDIDFESDFECYVIKIAELKCMEVAKRYSNSIIVSSDTIVVHNDTILTKPTDRKSAREMLEKLSGNTHLVYTSIFVFDQAKNKKLYECVTTKVLFFDLTDKEIDSYLDSSEPYDKAGAYGIQGIGARFVKNIEGCFYSVMGFPISRFIRMIEQLI
ncbi:MAG: septum formation protein Maf [Candidatus Delongbacteria bacterium]|nr:septum formation protein Maf [Candidatus Delongbacteria bacterium]MBN2833420.1 septum formation protein Maf [Candidatus Delongbacteria bacterium]